MSEILIQSKIAAPRLHSKIVHRGRLTSLLHENTDKSLIIICAPAGFGKTTLVLDYLTSYNNKHAWFSIPHKGIEDPSTFFEYLIGSVKTINNEFGKNTLDVLKQFTSNPKLAKELVYACTASFVNEFQKSIKEDILLVIDDLHYIDSEKSKAVLKEFFLELLDNIPANLHLVIVSRVMPDINLTALKAKRNVFIMDEVKLSFRKEETEKLLFDVYNIDYDDKDIKVLDENIKGWITGLHLLLQAYGEEFSKIKYEGEISYSNIYDFFADEIFDELDPELQEFLMVTSLMETFDNELVNSVLGISNSKELTEELLHKNLFIHQIQTTQEEKKNNSYGYHALFREFLNGKLKQSRIEEEIRNLLEKIGDSYFKLEDEITAINYYMEARKFDKTIPLIKKNVTLYCDNGKYDLVWNWINLLPKEIIESDAKLLYLMGYMYCYIKDDYNKSFYYADLAINLTNDLDTLYHCNTIKYTILIRTGKFDEAKTFLENLILTDLTDTNKVDAIDSLCYVYDHTGEYKKALELLEKTEKYCIENNLNSTKLYGSFSLIYSRFGDYKKAIHYKLKLLEHEKNISNIININKNIALCYGGLGDNSNCIKYFNKALDLLKGSYSKHRFIEISYGQAILYQAIGDYEESIRISENIYKIAEQCNMNVDQFLISSMLLLNYAYLKDQNNALKYLNLNKINANEIAQIKFNKLSLSFEAFYILEFDFNHSAIEKLFEAYNYFDSINDSYKYVILLDILHYYLKTNNTKLLLKYFKIHLKDETFYANSCYFRRELLDFVLYHPELTQYKDKVHNAFTEFFDRLNIEGTTEEYKQKMKIQIENIYDLKMNAFGGLEFISRGEIIPESKWKRKKSKSLLSYMMLNPKEKYSREHLTDLFVSDSNTKDIDDSFRHKISAINNAVKLPYLSILQHEGKMLFLNPDCYFKSDVAEFDKYYKSAHSDSISKEEKIKACKDAIGLYKGDLMKDNYEMWCEDLRDTYRNKYISVSELLLDLLYETKDIKNLIYYSEKLLSYDKLNEHAYLKLVEAHVESGKIRTAKETFSKMMKIFEEELAEKPDHKIISRIKELIY